MSMTTTRLALALVLGLLLACVAAAARASVSIDELYSNFDGSIQFVVLSRFGDPAPSLAGRTLVASDGTTTHRYLFPSDLPANPSHLQILLATQGFADLGTIQPDYIIPDGFLLLSHASVALDDTVVFDYRDTQLPTDGWHALYRGVQFDEGPKVYVAAAANARGDIYAFTPHLALSGLWWNPSEPGWALAVEQQGDTLFAAWATHDVDGSPTWFFVTANLGLDEDLGGSFASGSLYKATGPAFGRSFDASRVKVVGDPSTLLALGFSSSGETGAGTLYYDPCYGDYCSYITFTLTRAAFGVPNRQCFVNRLVAPGPSAPNYQGLWWNPSEPGWALHTTHQGDVVFAIWFTYDAAGKATWFSFAAQKSGAQTYTGTVYRTTGPAFSAAPTSSPVTNTAVGTATLDFTDRSHGTFAFNVNGISQTKAIEREIFANPLPECD